jgi:hypothetical protein
MRTGWKAEDNSDLRKGRYQVKLQYTIIIAAVVVLS